MRLVRLIALLAIVFPAMMQLHPDSSFAAAGDSVKHESVNLAYYAKPSTSYVSGHETLEAIHDGFAPNNSSDHRHGCYGNWPKTGTQWVQYDWAKPISTSQIEVYWWQDGQGIRLPVTSRLLYWDGNAFVPVTHATGLGVDANHFNITRFDELTSSKLRLEFDGEGQFSTGIIEWKVVDSGKSPKFPPSVSAGIERTVVMPGKTYLHGIIKGLPADGELLKTATPTLPPVKWSKLSGPGEVVFDHETSVNTAAAFSAAGDYVLQLTASVGELSSADSVHVKVEPPLLLPRLEPVYTRKYSISSPMWMARMKPLITHWIPHCIDEIEDPNVKEGGIDNLIEAGNKLAGRPYKPHVGYQFSNAWVHNTVESMCVALMVDPQGDAEIIKAQDRMRATLEKWIPSILASQEPDGYMQTRLTLGTAREEKTGHIPGRWTVKDLHEGYVAGYFIESAIADYLMTGGKDRRLYDAAKRLADCWDANIGPAPKKAWYDGHEELEQALVRFGRFVNDVEGSGKGDRYITLAKFLLDQRKNGEEYDQTHLPVIQQYEAVGHAVRASYLFSGMADVAAETHDVDYQSAVRSLWDNLVNKKWYVTGGIGSGETPEGFGGDYSLQNNAYCESCSNCGVLFFQWKMNLAYHQAKYADLYEGTLFNAILGDYDSPGNNFTYTNALDSEEARYPWHVCPCCVGNFPRTLLMLPTWMYSRGTDGLYVNLFLGSTVNVEKMAGTTVQMVQQTDYPYSGKIKITVNPAEAKHFAIRLRVPNRSVSTLYQVAPDVSGILSLSVNDQSMQPVLENGYAVIDREWKAGDTIELELPIKPCRVTAIDKVKADRGKVALMYGPLVYNIESVDQPIDKVLAPDSPLTTQWKPDLLGGVMVINGKFTDGSAFQAIPNYMRLNRGGRSIVWIRDR
jgi:DUF1680 family protein